MKIVLSQNSYDCGVAVASMLTGANYVPRNRAIGRSRGMKGIEMLEVTKGLASEIQICSEHKIIAETTLPPQNAALITKLTNGCIHWLAWDGELVYDPEGKVGDPKDFGKKYRVIAIFPMS